MAEKENVFGIIYPDGVKRGLVGECLTRFERAGFTLEQLGVRTPTIDFARQWYGYPVDDSMQEAWANLQRVTSGAVVPFVLSHGKFNSNEMDRRVGNIIGSSDPVDAPAGSIRGDFGVSADENVIGTFSKFGLDRDTDLWFPEKQETQEPVLVKDGKERTFGFVKPHAVKRGLVGKVLSCFENAGFKIDALKVLTPDEQLVRNHYAPHIDKIFFPGILEKMTSGPVVAFVLEGNFVVDSVRLIAGATSPFKATPGTVRRDYSNDIEENILDVSDSYQAASGQMEIWFPGQFPPNSRYY